jgi:hypothetical protein
MGAGLQRVWRHMGCPSCGSWAVKADRGLAGRMVCARCGHPLGLAASVRSKRTRQPWGLALPRRWRVWLALAGLVGMSAALAARAPTPSLREVPQVEEGRPSGPPWPTRSGGLGM